MKHYNVVAAILREGDKYLCLQRGPSKFDYTSYKYEFPGGKIELGETKAQALMRELREEMELEVAIADEHYFTTVEHAYPDFSITLHFFVVPVANPKFVLKEHKSAVWLRKDELHKLDWAAADEVVVRRIERLA